MTDFFTHVKKIADQLGAAGQPIFDKVQIRVLLAGVGNEYDSVVSNVTTIPTSFSLRDVQALLLNQEHRLATSLVYTSTDLHLAANNAYPGQTGTSANNSGNCGGHYSHGRGRGRNRGNSKFFCQLCRTPGHILPYCFS